MAKKKVNISRGKGAQRAFFTFAEDMELQYGPNIKEIAEAYSKDLVENTTKARKVLDKNMTGILVNVMSYLGRLRFFLNKFQLFLGKGFDVEAGRLPELRTALKNAGRALSESDKAIDHREVNVALVCLVVIFKYLEDMKAQLRIQAGSKADPQKALSDRRTKTGKNPTVPVEMTIGGVANPKKVILTYKELDQLIADVQYNIAGSAALQKLMIDSNFDGKDLNVLTQEFLEDVDYDLTATKEKIVNLAAGQGEATFAVTSNKFNRDKANYEKYFKRFPFRKALGGVAGVPKKTVADMKKNHLPNAPLSLTAMKGSKTVASEIANQAVETLVKGKSRRYKAKGKATIKKKISHKAKVPSVLKNTQMEQALTAAAFRKAADALTRTKTRKADRGEEELHTSQREINKVVTRINKRLPAEVRRNMGRPALINRTGRFSNSAELLSLKATRGGMAGNYTYMLAPYETFENTGERRWRSGYNPKPLIAKSIRNLAQQYTESKITILRRT